MRMRICTRGQQTGGGEINQTVTVHFNPILITNDSCNTEQTSVVLLLLSVKKFFVV